MKTKKPDCAYWNVWTGIEIEGFSETGKGQKTLFIRSLDKFPSLLEENADYSILLKSKCTRVWFCKEFVHWAILEKIAKLFESVCLEAEPKSYQAIPLKFRKTYRIFMKVDPKDLLKDGDVVCVGMPFHDEAFLIGTGSKVKPEQYEKDVKIA